METISGKSVWFTQLKRNQEKNSQELQQFAVDSFPLLQSLSHFLSFVKRLCCATQPPVHVVVVVVVATAAAAANEMNRN